MRAVIARYKKQEIRFGRLQNRPDREAAGAADGTGRQAVIEIGVMRRVLQQVPAAQALVECGIKQQLSVHHGRIAFEAHAFFQSEQKYACDERPFIGFAGFSLNQRGQGYNLMFAEL